VRVDGLRGGERKKKKKKNISKTKKEINKDGKK